tara:strand:- start:199 stop:912 length:714 start_codon:yes stop_codon:yes gene_type:complete
MKNILKKIDAKFFGSILEKKYTQRIIKNHIIKKDNLKEYKFLTYWNDHFNHLSKNNVEGDIIECGVGDGRSLSFILFNLIYLQKNFNRRYVGFDSFEGFPEPSNEDKSPRNPKKGDWNYTNEDFVISNLNHLGFGHNHYEKIKFIKGFYEKTFQQEKNNVTKISLLHLDCDLYSSTKISLETWFDKVEKNGLIVFDEYLNAANRFPGAVKAINEFFGEDKKKIKVCPYLKRYYLIKS